MSAGSKLRSWHGWLHQVADTRSNVFCRHASFTRYKVHSNCGRFACVALHTPPIIVSQLPTVTKYASNSLCQAKGPGMQNGRHCRGPHRGTPRTLRAYPHGRWPMGGGQVSGSGPTIDTRNLTTRHPGCWPCQGPGTRPNCRAPMAVLSKHPASRQTIARQSSNDWQHAVEVEAEAESMETTQALEHLTWTLSWHLVVRATADCQRQGHNWQGPWRALASWRP